MQNIESSEAFTYWKRPWHKWMILLAAAIQLLCLWMNVREYIDLSQAVIFSAFEWERYVALKNMQCALNAVAAVLFLGVFLIGFLARDRRTARRSEGLLLLFLALSWGAAGFVLPLTSTGGNRLLWLILLLLILGASIYSFWQSRKKAGPARPIPNS